MKQVLRKGLKHIVVDEVPDPLVLPHHVLVKPLYSLISSGTETASIHNDGLLKEVAENPSHLSRILNVMKSMGPVRTLAEVRAKLNDYAVLGYSGAGILVEKHETVSDFEVGDRVAYGGEGTGHGETILTGRHLIARVPDEVSLEHASFTTLGSIALNAVRIAQISIGDVVAVLGVGLVGQLIAQIVRLQGGVAVAIDIRTERISLAEQLGADHAVLAGDGVLERIKAITAGRGADCVIVAAAAKSAVPCQTALNICRDRGRIVVVGAVEMQFPWHEMYLKEIQLFMSRAYGPGSYDPSYEKRGSDYPIGYVRWTEQRNMAEFLRLVTKGQVKLDKLVTHQFELEDAAVAYQTIMSPHADSMAVVLRYPAAAERTAISFSPKHRVTISSSRKTASQPNTLRVGLVGAGNLARWEHLRNLRNTQGVSLRAICSTSGARGRSYASRFGAEYCCTDYDEIIKDSEIEVVFIVSRNQNHFCQALAALDAGKHVFVEKPMALTANECRELVSAVERSGKQLTVGFNRRFAPYYREQKERLARRSSPAVINCRINSPGISGSYWMADPSEGGAVLGEACHFVDLMAWLLDAEPIRVAAFTLPLQSRDPIGENNLAATFHFADGSVGNLTYCTVGSRSSGGERVEAYTQGEAVIVEDFKKLVIGSATRRVRSQWWADKGYAQQMQSFVDGIRQGRSQEVGVRDGARATIGCLAMLKSARRSSVVTIDLDAAPYVSDEKEGVDNTVASNGHGQMRKGAIELNATNVAG